MIIGTILISADTIVNHESIRIDEQLQQSHQNMSIAAVRPSNLSRAARPARDEKLQVWALVVVYGAYYGMVECMAKALVADLVPVDCRGTAYGVYNTAVGLTALLASLIAGVLWQGVGDMFYRSDKSDPAKVFRSMVARVSQYAEAIWTRGGGTRLASFPDTCGMIDADCRTIWQLESEEHLISEPKAPDFLPYPYAIVGCCTARITWTMSKACRQYER